LEEAKAISNTKYANVTTEIRQVDGISQFTLNMQFDLDNQRKLMVSEPDSNLKVPFLQIHLSPVLRQIVQTRK
jgi:hypothetical protein